VPVGAAAAIPRLPQDTQYLDESAETPETAAIGVELPFPSTAFCVAMRHQSPLGAAILVPSTSSASHAASNTI